MMSLILLIVSISAACSNIDEQASYDAEEIQLLSDDVYVGFVIDTLKEERWYNDKEIFEEEVKQIGGRVKTLAANGNDDVQIKQAELLIEEGVDVLVVVPHDAEISAKIVELAHAANVKVISYDRLIRNANVDYYLSFDNEQVGKLQAEEILKHVNEGNFAYVGGAESDNNAHLFRQGAMSVLQPYIDSGEIRLVFDEFTEGWNPSVAQENMEKALIELNNEVDAVIAANDGTAGGVITALTNAGLQGIPVSGQDAELSGVKRIVEGTQTMTVYKSIETLAKRAAELAVQVAKNNEIETNDTIHNGMSDVPSILLEPISVTRSNIQDTVIKDGYLTESEIYNE
ncbi:sugar ABC transporter substrate-binding protein [Alkalihalobacillus sp. MEB130]|uniref:sugar ABC transporter substrate-binding protein n=1 Tax=Alkalihalobacillus sp. MEB130 TaxID=2976704 RepID=UPI0037BE67F8